MFENYYQEDPQFNPEAGFGLGLSTVKQLVEQYHGTISVISYQGVGSEFILRLPLFVDSWQGEHPKIGQEMPELPRWVMVIGNEEDNNSDWNKHLSEHYHVTHTRGDYEDLMLIEDILPELVIINKAVLEPSDEELLLGMKEDYFDHKGPLFVALCTPDEVRGCQPIRWADYTLSKPLEANLVLSEIGRMFSKRQAEGLDELGAQSKEWQENVHSFVSKQIHDSGCNTSAVAKELYMSERTFQQRFKQEFGLSFKDYVTQFRFEQAAVMLKQGDKVSDVALACGFKDPSYFSARFKAYSGQTPTEFARGNLLSD